MTDDLVSGLAKVGIEVQVHTIVDKLKLRNDVQTDVGELILEHLQKHGQKVLSSPRK